MQQLWNTLKKFQNITLIDVLVVTETGKSSVRDYFNALEHYSYLKGIYPINQPKRWVLLKDTGGIAPANIRGIRIFDKNFEKLIHLSKCLRAKISLFKIKSIQTYNTTIKRFMSDLNGC
ncbi:MAG: hypothetical protein HRT37_26545 [Alteromonadaceae bacterium]|nr:hypothetical protein [Alteromonadaceae bacterium]